MDLFTGLTVLLLCRGHCSRNTTLSSRLSRRVRSAYSDSRRGGPFLSATPSGRNLLARRKANDGRARPGTRAGSQDVQRRIILGIEDHPITAQVTQASFVFISLPSYVPVVNRRVPPNSHLRLCVYRSLHRLATPPCLHRSSLSCRNRERERALSEDQSRSRIT